MRFIKLSFLVLGSCLFFNNAIFAADQIKLPNVSGQFYPANKDRLSEQIDGFFDNVKDDDDLSGKEVLAVIAPHAGYIYSGQVAAHSFKAVKGEGFDVVFIIAPTHAYGFNGVSVYKEGSFRTPLGDIKIDSDIAQKLISSNEIVNFVPEAFAKEHSLEVELPFLQKSLDNLKIVPMVVGQIDYADTEELAKAIIEATKGKKVLLVASTDLSHYHPYAEAVALDSKVISYIENLDSRGLWQANLNKECEMCGLKPVLILLHYAQALGLKPKVLNYANSGDVTGDKSGVVGYLSVVFYKDDNNFVRSDFPATAGSRQRREKGEEEMFNEAQKNRLLQIARQTVTDYVTKGTKPSISENDPQLNIQRGAFVTLHKEGKLKGCIGSFTSDEPICKLVSKMAIQSATQDHRFNPVKKEELDKIHIEISVLTEPQLIDDWKKIRLGIDGVIIRRGFSSGVFLPQVATETGWDLDTFLSQLCGQKAGLPPDCYKDPNTKIYTFQAFVFSEEE